MITKMDYITLNNGMKMPKLGIGTYMLSPKEAESSVLAALKAGYRHIDTANAYLNERAVGRAIRKSGVAREEIFLVTKLFPNTYKNASAQIDRTLKMLQVSYIDLLLLHQPYGKVETVWKACEAAVSSGTVKAIGVCNFTEKDMDRLLAYARIKPVLMQNESHPYHSDKQIADKYARYGIRLEAWYPLGHGNQGLLQEPVFRKLADKYHKSTVQIILRWHMQMDHIAIPGSKNPEHIKSNADIFDFRLTDSEMKEIGALDGKKKFFHMPAILGNLVFPNVKFNYEGQE